MIKQIYVCDLCYSEIEDFEDVTTLNRMGHHDRHLCPMCIDRVFYPDEEIKPVDEPVEDTAAAEPEAEPAEEPKKRKKVDRYKVKEMYMEGKSPKEIAEALGCSDQTIYNAINAMNLK